VCVKNGKPVFYAHTLTPEDWRTEVRVRGMVWRTEVRVRKSIGSSVNVCLEARKLFYVSEIWCVPAARLGDGAGGY
jgi:hypothetical protein